MFFKIFLEPNGNKKHRCEPWFSLVKLNIKTIEGRLNKGDFSNIKLIIYYIL